jgi:phosphopantetheinyl transferase
MSVAAIAAINRNVGIDIETIVPRDDSFLKIAFNSDELAMITRLDPELNEWASRFWCAKEAVGKALGQGLKDGPRSVEVCEADSTSGILKVKLGSALQEAFPEFEEKAIVVQTLIDRNLAVATTICETSPLRHLEAN